MTADAIERPKAALNEAASRPLVEIRGLSKRFEKRLDPVQRFFARGAAEEIVTAVDGVDLTIAEGQVLGLVGESGCGKSTLGRMVAGLTTPTAGEVWLDGKRIDLGGPKAPIRHQLRTQMIFQDPLSSLNPRRRVGRTIGEGPLYHKLSAGADLETLVARLLDEVGLDAEAANRLPHQFSGGQRQRVGIARALSVSPDFLICDEPVAALDVSIQAQIINLLLDLCRNRALTILFISHDLGVVRHLCDHVAVMYLGRIVESGRARDIFERPAHPYTRALLAEIPRIGAKRIYAPIKGELPSPLDPPSGCHFHPRCPLAQPICSREAPMLAPQSGTGQIAACHFADARPLERTQTVDRPAGHAHHPTAFR